MLIQAERLAGVHPDLCRVVRGAVDLIPFDIVVLEGVRSVERQRQLVAKGASETMRSRHLPQIKQQGQGCAVDLAPFVDDGHGQKSVSWHWPLFFKMAPLIKQSAINAGITVEWGGDWHTFKDGPHWQLPWGEYP